MSNMFTPSSFDDDERAFRESFQDDDVILPPSIGSSDYIENEGSVFESMPAVPVYSAEPEEAQQVPTRATSVSRPKKAKTSKSGSIIPSMPEIKPPAMPKIKVKVPSLFVGTGYLLNVSILAEGTIYGIFFLLIKLLKYEIPESTYQVIDKAFSPIVIAVLMALTSILQVRRHRASVERIKMSAGKNEFSLVMEREEKIQNEIGRVLMSVIAALIAYVIVKP